MRNNTVLRVIVFGAAVLLLLTGTASAADIRGTISTTLVITEDSQLVGDVTCTVTGAACIMFGASGISLKLNGFRMTGRADPVTACGGAETADEDGILVQGLVGVVIQGPGIVQRFRGMGINIRRGSARVLVTQITASTNCMSGIFVSATTDSEIEGNIAVRNASTTSFPCGGI